MKKYAILLFFVISTATVLFGQQDDDINTPNNNVFYKVNGTGDSLKLDVFLPDSAHHLEKTPVLLMIHGGAWVAGNRSLEQEYFKRSLRDQLVLDGVAVVSISYTLVNDSLHFPEPIQDCKDALRWISSHADAYNFDRSNIGLWGESAGAHLALLTAYTDQSLWPGTLAQKPYNVSYVVDNFGPTDLNVLLQTNASWFKLLMARVFLRKLLPLRERLAKAITGYSLQAHKEDVIDIAGNYSPLEYVNSSTVPTLILHGTKDKIVPIKESYALKLILDENQVDNELIVVEGGDHGFRNISEERIDILVGKTIDFIRKQVETKSSL